MNSQSANWRIHCFNERIKRVLRSNPRLFRNNKKFGELGEEREIVFSLVAVIVYATIQFAFRYILESSYRRSALGFANSIAGVLARPKFSEEKL